MNPTIHGQFRLQGVRKHPLLVSFFTASLLFLCLINRARAQLQPLRHEFSYTIVASGVSKMDLTPPQSFTVHVSVSCTEHYSRGEYLMDPYPFCYSCKNYPGTYQGLPFAGDYSNGSDGNCGCSQDGRIVDNTTQWYGVYSKTSSSFLDVWSTGSDISGQVTASDHGSQGTALDIGGSGDGAPLRHTRSSKSGEPSTWYQETTTDAIYSISLVFDNPKVKAYFSSPFGAISTIDRGARIFVYTDYKESVEQPWTDNQTASATIDATEGEKLIATSTLMAPSPESTTWSVSSSDPAVSLRMVGNKVYATLVDITPPPIPQLGVTQSHSSTNAFTFLWNDPGDDLSGVKYFRYSINDGIEHQTTALSAEGAFAVFSGENHFFVRAIDFAGNVSQPAGVSFFYNPDAPQILDVTPSTGPVGSIVTIRGIRFGSTRANSIVTFNDIPAEIVDWSDNTIRATVPTVGTSGPVVVTVNHLESNSNLAFVATDPIGASRSLPDFYTNDLPFTVTITVNPPVNTEIYAIQEIPPKDWTVADISDGGSFADGKLLWIFTDGDKRVLHFRVTPPLLTGLTAYFSGRVSFDPSQQEGISGANTLTNASAAHISLRVVPIFDVPYAVLSVSGPSGAYRVQVVDSLRPPLVWQDVGTLDLANGPQSWKSPLSGAPSTRFYRVISP